MQPTPFRLSQAIWTAFRAAKPAHCQSPFQYARPSPLDLTATRWSRKVSKSPIRQYVRAYSEKAKDSEIEKKVEEAKQKIDQSLDSRAEVPQDSGSSLKPEKDETIVHTLPEASSIVYARDIPSPESEKVKPQESQDDGHKSSTDDSHTNNNGYAARAAAQWQNSPLPSQIASLRSRATKRFATFMDNLQSNIVVASHHINDLTGYTGIERLKKEIEAQETAVQNARQHIKDSRDQYSEAIAMRSTTQREVNDLLHRKHAWSPTDLERFTHLYRSDHANEQTEQKAHQTLSEAETQYEEASTRLAKSILARYHEEQIWSDKIRQMSTWGTWGLMGLNVLLFIVFQILIEPWRRKRLVRGFEDKVQAALDEKERSSDEKFAIMQAQRTGDQVVQEALQKQPKDEATSAVEQIAKAVADAVTGASPQVEGERDPAPAGVFKKNIESAAEQVAESELELEALAEATVAASVTDSDPNAIVTPMSETPLPMVENQTNTELPALNHEHAAAQRSLSSRLSTFFHSAALSTRQTCSHYKNAFVRLFDAKEHVILSNRQLSTRVLEGVAAGAALTCGFMFVLAKQR